MDHFLPMLPVLAFTVEYQEVLNKGKVGTKGFSHMENKSNVSYIQ